MRATTAIGLLLVSTTSIFGVYGRHHANPSLLSGPEPVYVNGVMGVYNPDTGVFVPSTSPLFDQTCDLIQERRRLAQGNYGSSSGYFHHWYYSQGMHSFTYSGAGASASSSHIGSVRGGIGDTGHAFGGSHA